MDHEQYTGYCNELQDWEDMWQAAQEDKDFQPEPKTQESPMPIQNSQDVYLHYLDIMQNSSEESGEDEGLLQEDKTPNPVYPDSVGPDAEKPEPVWNSEDAFKEVEDLKNKLFELENKMAELGGVPKEPRGAQTMKFGEEITSEMKKLREKLEQISSNLGIKNEPSPWEVKKD